jgi:hypothetical protein
MAVLVCNASAGMNSVLCGISSVSIAIMLCSDRVSSHLQISSVRM